MANERGEAISRWWGYSKEMFFEELDLGFSDLTTIPEKETRYKIKPDAKTARILASYYNTRGEMKKAASLYEDAAKYDPNNDYAVELFQIYYSGLRGEVYTLEEVRLMANKAVNSESVDADTKTQIYAQMTNRMKAGDTDEKMLALHQV